MKTIYDIETMKKKNDFKKDFWIDLLEPTEEEVKEMVELFQIEESDLKKALDKSELPHVEKGKNYVCYIIHVPFVTESTKKYRSHPFGLYFLKNGIITASMDDVIFREELSKIFPKVTYQNSKLFSIHFISKSVEYFLKYLNEIQDEIIQKERTLKKATNKDLEKMLSLQKTLLYFTTSLQGNRMILEKIENNTKLNSAESDLLHDVQIEIKQAIEMANIYREILENTMDTYSSIISNNLNDIMKFLTSITLVISIPTMISSFLGMNVYLGEFGKNPYSFLLVVLASLLITIILILILKKKNLL